MKFCLKNIFAEGIYACRICSELNFFKLESYSKKWELIECSKFPALAVREFN